MYEDKATARIVGVLFIVATVAAVAGDFILRSLRDESDYLTAFPAHEGRVIMGMLMKELVAIAVIGIAVMIFPILKRHKPAFV